MGNAHRSGEVTHVASAKHIPYQTFVFVHMERAAVSSYDTRSILATMLQHCQSVIEQLIDWALGDDADNATHICLPLKYYGVELAECGTLRRRGSAVADLFGDRIWK